MKNRPVVELVVHVREEILDCDGCLALVQFVFNRTRRSFHYDQSGLLGRWSEDHGNQEADDGDDDRSENGPGHDCGTFHGRLLLYGTRAPRRLRPADVIEQLLLSKPKPKRDCKGGQVPATRADWRTTSVTGTF